jgi:gluconate:H+ symporter, GntP family
MLGVPFFQAIVLLATTIVLIAATHWPKLHPFLAITFIASAFGLAAGFPIGALGKAFGAGFSQMAYSPGLTIVAAGFVAGIAESTAASDWLRYRIDHYRWVGPTRLAALWGLIAGIGASPATAFALLVPLLGAVGDRTQRTRESAVTALALAISASHGLVLFSPVPIAAASILNAAWGRVALFGLPLAILLTALGALWARWLSAIGAAAQARVDAERPVPERRGARSAIVLIIATVVPLLLLMFQSLGELPSEPLGGGTARELVIGVGRPLILFLVAVGIVVVGLWRPSVKLLTDPASTGRVVGDVAGVLLIVGAAGGLQRLCQDTGMAELLGERALTWHVGGFAGLFIPFLIAAIIKTLQGSSLVAAITAAGIVQPMLASLGISGANGTALAALAIGAGAMTVSHVNDEYFWLVTATAGLRPLRGIGAIAIGTLLQGLIAVGALLVLFVLTAR